MRKLFVLLSLLMLLPLMASCDQKKDLYSPYQTSADLLIRFSQQQLDDAPAAQKTDALKRHTLAYDIYIKSRSYAILNKVFFWLSLMFGVAVLLWPSLSIIFSRKLGQYDWVKSATVQTTVTGLAALMFAFYAQYKDKQVYTESLIRHVIYSEEDLTQLAARVSEELVKIDSGFSFSSATEKNKKQ